VHSHLVLITFKNALRSGPPQYHSQPSTFVTVLSVLWIPIPVDIPSLKSDFCKMKFLWVKMLSSTFTLARINIILWWIRRLRPAIYWTRYLHRIM